MSIKLWAYSFWSSVLIVGVVVHAFHLKQQFYPATLHLTNSKFCSLVLGNFMLMMVILTANLMRKLFLGNLRELEIEHLTDRVWGTVMDTLLMTTIFRSEFNSSFISWFIILIFCKIFHWLAQDRVDFMQHAPVSTLTSVRIFLLMMTLALVDSVVLYRAATVTSLKGPNMMMLFGFEFLILLASVLSTSAKFVIQLIDSRQQRTWERKGEIILYLEAITDIFQLLVYLLFFSIVIASYGFPLHILRNVYLTMRSLKQCIQSLVRYRKATSNMNERFPDVTEAELRDSQQICIVCREELTQGKRLPCGHILHFHCLLNWLQRQQTCPMCRASVLDTPAATVQQPPQAQQFQWPPEIQEQWERQIRDAAARQESSGGNGMQGATASSLQQPEGNTTLDHLLSAVPEIMQGIQVLQIQVQTLQDQVSALSDQLAVREVDPTGNEVEQLINSCTSQVKTRLSAKDLDERQALLRRRVKAAVASFKEGS